MTIRLSSSIGSRRSTRRRYHATKRSPVVGEILLIEKIVLNFLLNLFEHQEPRRSGTRIPRRVHDGSWLRTFIIAECRSLRAVAPALLRFLRSTGAAFWAVRRGSGRRSRVLWRFPPSVARRSPQWCDPRKSDVVGISMEKSSGTDG